jgi:hypothetical protein
MQVKKWSFNDDFHKCTFKDAFAKSGTKLRDQDPGFQFRILILGDEEKKKNTLTRLK